MKTFTTKDSGQRQDYPSGMVRDIQEGKPRFDLLYPSIVPYEEQFLTRCAELMARGAEKYGDNNWTLANSEEELQRFKASAIRHLTQWINGEDDEDHAAATFFNLMAYESIKYKMEQAEIEHEARREHFYDTFPFSDEVDGHPVWVDETRYWVDSMTSDQAAALTNAFRMRAAGKYVETSTADEAESIYCECGCNELADDPDPDAYIYND